jgi:hypothetical protein
MVNPGPVSSPAITTFFTEDLLDHGSITHFSLASHFSFSGFQE